MSHPQDSVNGEQKSQDISGTYELKDIGQNLSSNLVQTVDVKVEQNTKGFNVGVHMYEFATRERIDAVIENAIYAMKKTNARLAQEMGAVK